MNIQQFRYVLAVASSNNFEDASEKCFVTQSTLSTMIGRFEDEIGIKIFNRRTKPVSITKEGIPIIDRLRIIINEIDSFKSIIKEMKGEVSGDVKIGVIPTIAPYLLPLFLPKFASDFPELHITIKEITTEEIITSLKKRIIDIGIVALPTHDKELKTKELYKEPFIIYDCTEEKTTTKIPIKQLNSSKLWLLQEGHCMRTQIDKICQVTEVSKNKNANFAFESASMSSLLNFTKSNKGMTIIPHLALKSMNLSERERIINFESPIPVRSVGLVTHQYFAKKQLLKKLEEYIIDSVNSFTFKEGEFQIIEP